DGGGHRRHRLPPGHGGGRRRGVPRPPGDGGGGPRDLRHHPDRCDLRPDLHGAGYLSHADNTPPPEDGPVVEVRGLKSAFGDRVIHDDLNLTVNRGEILAVVGGSGSGKSVLLNTIIGLKSPEAGSVK